MKPSFYNHFIQNAVGNFIYNASTGAMLKVPANDYELLKNGLIELSLLKTQLKLLIDGNFIVDKELDEVNYQRIKYELHKYNTTILALTICPTMQCNFACQYCFQDPEIKTEHMMETEVVNKIIDFISCHINNIKIFKLEWFGGEPLLNIPLITRTTSTIRDICERHNVVFSCSMTSNGYLLTKDVAKELSMNGVTSLQVTIDGTQTVHDKFRPLKNGRGTFNTITANAIAARNFLDISIRTNVTKQNIENLDALYNEMDKLGLSDILHIEKVTNEAEYFRDRCSIMALNVEEFAKLEVASIKRLKSINELKYRLIPRPSFCAAVTLGMLVIDPEGYLYKCWHEVGIKNCAIGHISNDITLQITHTKWLSASPYEYHECKTCKVLPLCQGGCFFQRFRDNINIEWCSSMKKNIYDLLNLAIDCHQNSPALLE